MKQSEKLTQLLELMQANPELPVIPCVDGDVVSGDEYYCWLGSWGESAVQEFVIGRERTYYREDDISEMNDVLCEHYDPELVDNMTEEETRAAYNALPWKKAIFVDTPTSKSSSRSGSMLARTHSRATGTTLYPRRLSARAQPESCAPAAISRRATGLASTCIRSPASRLRPGSTQRPSSSNRVKRPLTCPHRSGAAHRTRSTPAQAWLRVAERPQT